MKTKQINGKTAGNSLENGRKLSAVENVFHAVKTAARTVFAASALGVLLAGTAFAAAGEDAYQMAEGTESYADVYDMADLFTDEEEKQLSEQAQVLSDTMKMEAVIVTTEENSGSAQVFADGFYMEGGFGTGSDHSGILFLIDMDNRELYISQTDR